MKALFAAAILVVSAPALAQPDPNAQSQPDVATNAGPQERDARGIPVINAAPNIPPGVNQTVQAVPGATYQYQPMQMQTRPATMDYPPCTRGQTDRCVQAYEVGRRPRR
jgi:hypothetical protein